MPSSIRTAAKEDWIGRVAYDSSLGLWSGLTTWSYRKIFGERRSCL
jgi:hypothetical protein